MALGLRNPLKLRDYPVASSSVSGQYWRMYCTAVNGAGSGGCALMELDYYDMTNTLIDTVTNAATNAIASSFVNFSNRPALAYDDTTANGWSAAAGVPQWLGYDFAAPVTVKKIRIYSYIGFPTYAPSNFILEVASNVGGPWTQVGSAVVGASGWTDGVPQEFTFQ